MPHLEGVLTLVSSSGPWFRIQGAHLRDPSASRFGARLALDPASGLTADLHFGTAVWVRLGWYPAHTSCKTAPSLSRPTRVYDHRCWGRWLTTKVFERGLT